MATTNKSLIQQTYNTGTGNLPANQIVDPAWIATPYSNWSVPVNYDFGAIDLAMGGSVSISVTSVVVSPQSMVLSQYQPMSIIFTGVLSANLVYALPSSVGGTWAVYNNTTGAFTLTMTTPAGTSLSVVIPSGGPNFVVCNSTTGISIYQSSVPDGSITSAKLASTTGSGSVVLAGSPTLSGAPLSTTAAVDTNTTQIATTAYVVGQGYLKSATAASTYQTALGFNPIQQGGGTSQLTNKIYMGWSASSQLRVQVDSADFGVTWPINISGSAASWVTLNGGTALSSTTTTIPGLSLGGYNKLKIVVIGASTTAPVTATALRVAGVNMSSAGMIGPATLTAVLEIDLLSGLGMWVTAESNGSHAVDGNAYGITAGTTSLTFTNSNSNNFDAGTVYVYGQK